MNEMLQDEVSLASQTHGCCEGQRRPTVPFHQRHLRTPEIADCPSQVVVMPVGGDVLPGFNNPYADALEETNQRISDRAAQVIQERGEIYGPFDVNMYGTALQISGMLAQYYSRTDLPVLPAYMAAMIATAFKSNRIVKSPTHEDSHLDLGVYLGKAKELVTQE